MVGKADGVLEGLELIDGGADGDLLVDGATEGSDVGSGLVEGLLLTEGALVGFELGSPEGAALVEGAAVGTFEGMVDGLELIVGWDVPNSGPKPPPSPGALPAGGPQTPQFINTCLPSLDSKLKGLPHLVLYSFLSVFNSQY